MGTNIKIKTKPGSSVPDRVLDAMDVIVGVAVAAVCIGAVWLYEIHSVPEKHAAPAKAPSAATPTQNASYRTDSAQKAQYS